MKTKTILIWTFVAFVIIGLGAPGTSLFLKSYLKTEDATLPQVINSTIMYPNLEFKKAHKIKINNQEKAIFRSYQIQPTDLKEGENIINISRKSLFGLSGPEKSYTVFVDRIKPEIKLSGTIPQEVINTSDILVPIDSPGADNYFVNDSPANLVNGNVSARLQEGENTIRVSSQDTYGNRSKPLEIKIINDKNQKWQQNACGEFIYTLNAERLQIGYSGVENRPEITNQSDTYFAQANTPVCSSDRVYVPMYPLGSKALCWNCDGGYSYINISKSDNIINRPSAEVFVGHPNVVSAGEYTTKSGIVGDLIKKVKDQTVYRENPIQTKVTSLSFAFLIDDNEYVVSGSGSDYNPQLANVEKDFMEVIDHLYLTNREKIQENKHVTTQGYKSYIAKEGGDFEISYPVSWKVTTKKAQATNVDGSVDRVYYNLTNGEYAINITQTEVGKSGYCAGLFSEDEEKVYSDMVIDGVSLSVPLVTKTKFQGGIGFGTNVYRIESKSSGKVGYCTFTAGKGDYMINVYTSERGTPVNSFDETGEKEIIEILKSIKWAKK
jgi:hypothetical protein